MSIIFVLIIISVVIAGGFLLVFFWAAGSGQFDDLYTPSVRMLFDEQVNANPEISLPEIEESNGTQRKDKQ